MSLNTIKSIKQKQKEQKAAYKAVRLENEARQIAIQAKQKEFKSDASIEDVFAILHNAHDCVPGVWKVDGVLSFLDTVSIGRLALSCKTLNSDIKESTVLLRPDHKELISNNTARAIAIRARIASEREYEKQKYVKKIQRQLIHFGKMAPEKFNCEKKRIRKEWMERYNTKIMFSTWSYIDGTFYERIR